MDQHGTESDDPRGGSDRGGSGQPGDAFGFSSRRVMLTMTRPPLWARVLGAIILVVVIAIGLFVVLPVMIGFMLVLLVVGAVITLIARIRMALTRRASRDDQRENVRVILRDRR